MVRRARGGRGLRIRGDDRPRVHPVPRGRRTNFAGDEAVLVRIEATPFDAPVVVSYLAMVRVGDTVATVGVNLDDPRARALAIRAAARLG